MDWSFKKLILILAGFFILLHNTIPHTHHIVSKGTVFIHCEKNDVSIFGFIKVVLHQNAGEGHLEHFVKGQSLEKSVGHNLTFLVFNGFDFDKLRNAHAEDAPTPEIFHSGIFNTSPPYLTSFSYRGPPFFA